MDMFLPAVLFRLADGAAMPTGEASAPETVALLRNLRRSSSDMSSPFTSPLLFDAAFGRLSQSLQKTPRRRSLARKKVPAQDFSLSRVEVWAN